MDSKPLSPVSTDTPPALYDPLQPVTLSHKCYVFACLECGRLAYSARSDAVTCSVRCRVKAHRKGTVKAFREDWTRMWGHAGNPALVCQLKAVSALRPDLFPLIHAGHMSLADIRADIWTAFWDMATEQAQNA